ncbi:hypothetical protein [Bacillus sp. NEB1478]|uniref:hypothetical protein n=1 Tax=Bacillus sp. NEB1478 TaxID=3073816 RepID=UPI00287321EA|nr:hypothetical protein [Bacillus sp. NEB1478]WNB91511.1 hypothetical protein RGB74_16665 [Bacillus sp. NEB1478]
MNIYYLEKMMEHTQKELSKVSVEAWKRKNGEKRISVFYSAFKKISSFKGMKKSTDQCKTICCS